MTDDTPVKDAAAEEFSAAAPPDPEASGAGETSFADAQAPPAGEPRAEPAASAGTGEAEPGEGEPGQPDTEPTPSADSGEAAKFRDLAMRKQAEFENYRKRMARENAQAAERGAARVAKELLPALDHLELSLKAAEGHADADVVRGFALVRDEILAALAKSGIEAFSPEGEAFDPNEHEAMVQQPAEGAESGTVLQVYQQGFRINGQILRPARVVVAA
jgi:molecular chaperone GrpE